MDDKEAQAEGGRRFQREGPATENDLDLALVILVQGTKSSRLSRDRRGRWDKAGVGSQTASEIFRCHPHLGLKQNKENFVFNTSRD